MKQIKQLESSNWNQANVSTTSPCEKSRYNDQSSIPASCYQTITSTEFHSWPTTWNWRATARSRGCGVKSLPTSRLTHLQCDKDDNLVFWNDGCFFCSGGSWGCCGCKSRGIVITVWCCLLVEWSCPCRAAGRVCESYVRRGDERWVNIDFDR